MAIPTNVEAVAQLDVRMKIQGGTSTKLTIRYVRASILQRLRAEFWLARNSRRDDSILCFGNLPPLFKLRGHVAVFVQNRYLIDNVKLNGFPLKTRLRLATERLWLSCKMVNADEFVVQTPTMKNLLEIRTKGKIPVYVSPFVANYEGRRTKSAIPEDTEEKDSSFIYIASGEPHKNHQQLIEAWCLLATEGLFPSLKLTLDQRDFAGLCSWMEQKIEQYRLNIENLGRLPHKRVQRLYEQSHALIYPSTCESFGLPLIEATQAGLPVLASELDYVRDVSDPEQTFDPESAVSIARAVKRFMRIEEQPLRLEDAAGFIKHIVEGAESRTNTPV